MEKRVETTIVQCGGPREIDVIFFFPRPYPRGTYEKEKNGNKNITLTATTLHMNRSGPRVYMVRI